MSYKFLETILEDWQVESFRFAGQRNKEVVNESESFVQERLLINEKQVYSLSLQGLTEQQYKEIYKQARDYTQIGYKSIFYGISSNKNDLYYNETINMNYIGDTEFGFTFPVDYKKISKPKLRGILFDITVEIVEER